MHSSVELLDSGIIYIIKIGDQSAGSLSDLYDEIREIAAELRAQNKPVLVLANAEKEGVMEASAKEVAIKIGQDLDFDKSATFGPSLSVHITREQLIKTHELDHKVANFRTRDEAMAWLMEPLQSEQPESVEPEVRLS